MTDHDFEALLTRMPNIAEVVNAFKSEVVQAQAFEALISVLVDGRQLPAERQTRDRQPLSEPTGKAKPARKARTGRSSGRTTPEIVHELNLHPDGKTSFPDFIAEKRPNTNEEKYAVVVYYLEKILEIKPISDGHVAAVFRMTSSLREPSDVYAGLRKTSTRKATIDMSDRNNIRTTPTGRNFVEHDLPAKAKSK